jgi:N6-adenosine-specific RNA methylase IME4
MTEVSSTSFSHKRYDVLLVDPPWTYTNFGTASVSNHYGLLDQEAICSLPIRQILKKKAFVFVWATGPRLDYALEAIKSWGLHYRGIAFVWVKTRKSDNAIISGQGVPPTFTKPTTEMLLCATTTKAGRPVPLRKFNAPQVILAPRGGHSEKPEVFRETIEETLGGSSRDYLEMFARKRIPGWDAIGDEVCNGEDIRESLRKMTLPPGVESIV